MSAKQRNIVAGTLGLLGVVFFYEWATRQECREWAAQKGYLCGWVSAPGPLWILIVAIALFGAAWFVWAGRETP